MYREGPGERPVQSPAEGRLRVRSVLFQIPVPSFLESLGLPGAIPVYSYGVAVLVSFLLTIRLAQKRAGRLGVAAEKVQDIALWTIIGGIAGARLMHVALYRGSYASFADVLRLYNGGLVLHGAFIAVPAVLLILSGRHALPLADILKIFIPLLPMSIGIGRLGCFLNGCCYGAPATTPWGISYAPDSLYPGYDGGPVHPVQIYAFVLGLALSSALLLIEKARPGLGGWDLSMAFLGGYGLTRLLEEHFRDDTPAVFLGMLNSGQAASILLMLLCTVYFLAARFYRTRNP